MLNSFIISKYLFRGFTNYFLMTSGVVVIILFLANAFEVLQRFRSIAVSPDIFWQLISWKVPYLFCEINGLIVFFSTLLFLYQISRYNEIVVILGSGISIWKIFMIPMIATFIFGIIIIGVLSPIGTYGLLQYKKLDSILTNKPRSSFIVSRSGIFFFETEGNINRIIQAKSINPIKDELYDILILNVDDKNNLVSRLDSPKAILRGGDFELFNPILTTQNSTIPMEKLKVATKLTINNLMEQFIPPELISVWNLRSSIDKFSNSGLSTTSYKLYYFKQLFKPLIMVAMTCLACWFVSLNIRDNSQVKIIFIGSMVGIVAYFLLELIPRILAFGGIEPMYAILLPVIFMILFSNFVILHFQEA